MAGFLTHEGFLRMNNILIKKKVKGSFVVAVSVLLIALLLYITVKNETVSPVTEVKFSSEIGQEVKRIEPEITEELLLDDKKSRLLNFTPNLQEPSLFTVSLTGESLVEYSTLMGELFNTATSMNQPKKEAARSINSEFSAMLHLKYYPSDKLGRWHVAAALDDIQYSVDHQPLKQSFQQEMLHSIFTFDLTNKGLMSRFQFMNGVNEMTQQQIKAVLMNMQIALPDESKGEWYMREVDEQGSYKSKYNIRNINHRGVVVDKVKEKYFRVYQPTDSSQIVSDVTLQVDIKKSSGEFILPLSGGWIEQVESRIETENKLNHKILGRGVTNFSAKKILNGTNKKFPETYQALLDYLQSSELLQLKYSSTDRGLNELGDGLNLENALDLFKKMDQRDKYASKVFLINYLRQYPKMSYELVSLLDTYDAGGFAEEDQHRLWYILAEVGHEDAQQAMSDAFYLDDYSKLTRMRSLSYMHDIEYPQPFIVDKLHHLYQNKKEGSDELGVMAIYAIGSLGNKERLNAEVQQQTAGLLSLELSESDNEKSKIKVLQAMGNHGGEELLVSISDELESESWKVRAAAFESMRRMEGEDAESTLIDHLNREESEDVRVEAVKSLSKMKPSQLTMDWAKGQALTVKDLREQLLIVRYIGENLNEFPANENVLRELVGSDIDVRIKQEIYSHIKP